MRVGLDGGGGPVEEPGQPAEQRKRPAAPSRPTARRARLAGSRRWPGLETSIERRISMRLMPTLFHASRYGPRGRREHVGWRCAGEEALLELAAPSCCHRASDPLLVQADAAGLGELEQPLALLSVPCGLDEDPAEEADGEDALLEHHRGSGCALIPQRLYPPVRLARAVRGVEDDLGPEEHVGQQRAAKAHADDVEQLGEI